MSANNPIEAIMADLLHDEKGLDWLKETVRDHPQAQRELDEVILNFSEEGSTSFLKTGGAGKLLLSKVRDRLEEPDYLDTGSRAGRYLIEKKLGEGGMGVVYAAYDPELDRSLAIKVLHFSRITPSHAESTRERLTEEARALASLSHPNVVNIYDIGTVDGHVFIAMERVRGGDLEEWLEQKERGWKEIIARFVEAGCGLAAAHSAGLVHRDFKPQNVLIGEDGRPRVADFGLAMSIPGPENQIATPSEGSSGSSSSPMEGTPAYMAPEQYWGEEIGPAADQFSFCVSLWEALYGKRPFAGKTWQKLMMNLAKGEIVPPGKHKVPKRFERLLRRGLAKKPEDRWPTFQELLEQLENEVEARRKRIVGLGVAMTLSIAALGWTWFQESPDPCRSVGRRAEEVWSVEERTRVEDTFQRANLADDALGIMEGAVSALDSFSGRWVEARTEACAATHIHGEQSSELLDLRMECLDKRLDSLDDLLELIVDAERPTLFRATESIKAIPPLELCANRGLLTAEVPSPSDEEARLRIEAQEASLVRANNLLSLGKGPEANEILNQIQEEVTSLAFPPLSTEYWRMKAALAVYGANYRQGRQWFFKALSEAITANSQENIVRILTEIQLMEGNEFYLLESAERWDLLVKAYIKRLGSPPAFEFERLRALWIAYEASGQSQRSLDILHQAEELVRDNWEEESHQLGTVLNGKGLAYLGLKEYDKAILSFQRERSIREKLLGQNHSLIADILSNEGIAYGEKGNMEEARAVISKAIAIYESLGDFAIDMAYVNENLALTWIPEDPDRALEILRRSERAYERYASPQSLLLAGIQSTYVDIYRASGNLGAAETAFRTALQKYRESGEGQADAAITQFELAEFLRDECDKESQARVEAQEALLMARVHGPEALVREIEEWLLTNSP